MLSHFEVFDVSRWLADKDETLGTKTKVWLADPAGRRWLFKEPRARTGDDWSEKITAELAALLGIPHAPVELGSLNGRPGSLSLDFTRSRLIQRWRLAPLNELLFELDPTYPREQFRGVQRYTVDRVLDLLIEYGVGPSVLGDGSAMSAPEIVVGYLLFDAWIGNQDRHHENTGVLFPLDASIDSRREIAPSYDHAAGLGQILSDQERAGRLETKDRGYSIESWAAKARGALYGDEMDQRPLTTFDAFARASMRYPRAGSFWLDRLSAAQVSAWNEVLERLPEGYTSLVTKRFSSRMLGTNRTQLLDRT